MSILEQKQTIGNSADDGVEFAGRVLSVADLPLGDLIQFNLDRLENPGEDIARELIGRGYSRMVLANKCRFAELGDLLVDLVIKNGDIGTVAEQLYSLRGLSENVAIKLIAGGYSKIVAKFISHFAAPTVALAEGLLRAGEVETVVLHAENFGSSDLLEIAARTIKFNGSRLLVRHIDRFPHSSHQAVALMLIENGYGSLLGGNLGRFHALDEAVATALREGGLGWVVNESPWQFRR